MLAEAVYSHHSLHNSYFIHYILSEIPFATEAVDWKVGCKSNKLFSLTTFSEHAKYAMVLPE